MMHLTRLWNSVLRNSIIKTARRNYGGGNHRPVRLNDMPVPEGDFYAHNAKRQFANNLVLALGAMSCGFGLTLYNTTDIVNFHFSPPDNYE